MPKNLHFYWKKNQTFCDVNYQNKFELYRFGFEVIGNSLEVIFTKKPVFCCLLA